MSQVLSLDCASGDVDRYSGGYIEACRDAFSEGKDILVKYLEGSFNF